MYDTYNSYSPGFLGVGTLGILGALILPLIAIALPRNNGQPELDGELAGEKAKQDAATEKDKARETESKESKAKETESREDSEGREQTEVDGVRKL